VPTILASSPTVLPVNGIQLAYQSFGSGGPAPLILLHGGFGSVEMFGPNVDAFAAGRRVVGVDLQSHGRSPAADRPMRFESMADDIAELIRTLDLGRADVLGFSLGGAVALRLGIQHPDVVRRLVLVSTPVRRSGWYPAGIAGFDAMGPETAAFLRQTPLFEAYAAIAPNVDDFQTLVNQLTTQLKVDYDYSAEARDLPMPVMLVIGDADAIPPRGAVELFELLGGGQRDGSWDRSGMTPHRLAILPGVTHYDINVHPSLPAAVTPFLDED
jgi:pimeloyl-ACP methyl ester carboxylesterase